MAHKDILRQCYRLNLEWRRLEVIFSNTLAYVERYKSAGWVLMFATLLAAPFALRSASNESGAIFGGLVVCNLIFICTAHKLKETALEALQSSKIQFINRISDLHRLAANK
ncbi:hypothetical protein [Photobacterium kishitanii]|uniref:Uncharacterized protein n=1 Tax=Photobacterium kishitanii TaxID=318456 RepID=A0A2T3KM21_9GAMM|nr:hypothetical protein [Photobacterium kishitanii]PSV00744.1 hypothetical protein C9J27_06270 [Photobacterium kishitanii]